MIRMIEYNNIDSVETIQEQDIDFTRTSLVIFLKKYWSLNDSMPIEYKKIKCHKTNITERSRQIDCKMI